MRRECSLRHLSAEPLGQLRRCVETRPQDNLFSRCCRGRIFIVGACASSSCLGKRGGGVVRATTPDQQCRRPPARHAAGSGAWMGGLRPPRRRCDVVRVRAAPAEQCDRTGKKHVLPSPTMPLHVTQCLHVVPKCSYTNTVISSHIHTTPFVHATTTRFLHVRESSS